MDSSPSMRATSQVAERSPSYFTASESGVRSRRSVDRCFGTEPRIPTAKHCGMFRREPRGACVRRSGGPTRRFRHQCGCGCNQAQTIGGEAVAGVRGVHHRAGACESHSQGRRRSTGGEDRSDPVFQPSNGGVTQTIQTPESPGRFTPVVSRAIWTSSLSQAGSVRHIRLSHVVPGIAAPRPDPCDTRDSPNRPIPSGSVHRRCGCSVL